MGMKSDIVTLKSNDNDIDNTQKEGKKYENGIWFEFVFRIWIEPKVKQNANQ